MWFYLTFDISVPVENLIPFNHSYFNDDKNSHANSPP